MVSTNFTKHEKTQPKNMMTYLEQRNSTCGLQISDGFYFIQPFLRLSDNYPQLRTESTTKFLRNSCGWNEIQIRFSGSILSSSRNGIRSLIIPNPSTIQGWSQGPRVAGPVGKCCWVGLTAWRLGMKGWMLRNNSWLATCNTKWGKQTIL